MQPPLPFSSDPRARLGRRFHKQQEFAAGYSPLYSRLFGLVADWLTAKPGDDPLADWLVRAGADCASFDVPLLLLAGLHRDILAGRPETSALARYYPTVGGSRPIGGDDLASCFRTAVAARQEALAAFIATARVQTNETARGLCWLLPVCTLGWPALHLVDMGASAGLNLVADQRHFQVVDAEGAILMKLGNGKPPQFEVQSEGAALPLLRAGIPGIRSRLGCDLAPLVLHSPEEEQALAAFIWGDQPQRLQQLRAGIAALHTVNRGPSPVRLVQADLAAGLSRRLIDQFNRLSDAPIVLYNTYLTTYLADKGASLHASLAAWAHGQKNPRPVLWLQWEHLRGGPKPPEFGWIGWTADLWTGGRHRHWHLAWVHPHGARIRWTREMADWIAFGRGG